MAAPSEDFDAAAIVIAIAAGVQIGCLQSIGDVTMTRAVQEYTCISSDESTKSQGSVTLGNQELSTLFNAADTAGQQDLRDMWRNSTRRILIVALNDEITPTTGNPTYITFESAIAEAVMGIAKDDAVKYKPTIEITTKPNVIDAT